MKEINLDVNLASRRRRKGVTQDELAEYIGVSKAAVSKWETGQSYPDITTLPQLAAYFNTSIDELMGYSPQMTKEDIRKLYHTLADCFANESFEKTLAECRSMIKKYYSCFPLLLQMAILLINHHMLAETEDEKAAILREAAEICARIRKESGDIWLSESAIGLEAICRLTLKQPEEVLELLGEEIRQEMPLKVLISNAYMQMGKSGKAKEVAQIDLYLNLVMLFNALVNCMNVYAQDPAKLEEILYRALSVADIFDLQGLNPNSMLGLYASGSAIFCLNGDKERALDLLNKYVDVCVADFFPFTLHGDSFFDSIENWLNGLVLGASAPRSEKVVRDSMLDVLINPIYSNISDRPEYKEAVCKLKKFIGGN